MGTGTRIGLAALLLLTLSVGVEATNGSRRIGYGTKARGMGGVAIALPQDAFVVASNPAGLSRLCDRIDIEVDWSRQTHTANLIPLTIDSDVCDDRGRHVSSDDDFFWPGVALNRWLCCDQAFGLAVYGYGGFETSYNGTQFGLDRRLGMEWRQYLVQPTWMWAYNEGQAIGISFDLAFSWLDVRGITPLLSGDFFQTAPPYVSDEGREYQAGVGMTIGWIGDLLPGLTGGVVYQSPVWTNKFKQYRGLIAQDGDLHLPDVWGIGLSYCVCGGLTVGLDWQRIMWSHTKMFRHDLASIGYDSNLQNIGGPDGVGFGWQDQSVVKLGIGWDVCNFLTLRLGYNWGDSQMDPRDVPQNVLTQQILTNHFTFGLTWYLDCCGEVSLSYVHGFPRSVRRAPLVNSNGIVNGLRNKQESVGLSFGRTF